MRVQRKSAAFTLIELLSVVAILGLLASLLLPAIGNVRESAHIASSSSNIRQLVAANINYAQANNGMFAYATNERNSKRWCAGLSGGKWDRRKGYLSPYFGEDIQAANCPLMEGMLDDGGPSFEEGTGGYGYNSAYIGGIEGKFLSRPSARMTQVRDPSRTVMFTTSAYARAEGVQEYPFSEPPFWTTNGTPNGSRPSPSVHFRANGQAIVGWVDGHVSLESPNDRPPGDNPHGGDSQSESLGWFGPDDNNGYWNPSNEWSGDQVQHPSP